MSPQQEALQNGALTYEQGLIAFTQAISQPANGAIFYFQTNQNLNQKTVKYLHAINPNVCARTINNKPTAPLEGALITLLDNQNQVIQEMPLALFDPTVNLNLFNQTIGSLKSLNLPSSYIKITDASLYTAGQAFQVAFYCI
jgi:hypothetical protein